MKNKQLYTSAITLITFFLIACNGGQLDDVKGDAAKTQIQVTDSTDLNIQQEIMATVTSDTLQTDSRQFLNELENKLSVNIHLSKAAMNQSSNEEVKNLGKTIADQLTELHNKLKEIAQSKNINLASDMTPSMQEALKSVTDKKGTEFNSSYLNRVVKESKATIDWLESRGPQISDQQLQQFPITAIPVFKQHLDAAEALKAQK